MCRRVLLLVRMELLTGKVRQQTVGRTAEDVLTVVGATLVVQLVGTGQMVGPQFGQLAQLRGHGEGRCTVSHPVLVVPAQTLENELLIHNDLNFR
uniref:Putative secreted protein n=1 Tax=Anopheles darlingi TaxID=43151 RepID=A0A2M4D448_ANODA